MGTRQEVAAANRRQGRRWRFASAILDEGSWTLLVDGQRTAIEPKPLELLHELLLRAGQLVTKEELLDAIWPGVSVVEASLPTAVAKLRRALGSGEGAGGIIETVPRLGYRLAVPVELEAAETVTSEPGGPRGGEPNAPATLRNRHWLVIPGGLALALVLALAAGVLATSLWRAPPVPVAAAAEPQPPYTQRDATEAIRKLDVGKIEAMLRAGWNPNTPFDDEGNGAMTFALNICEWNPSHDKARLLLIARTLLDAGVRIDSRNKWGDTPYSIAKAKRYCGPDHPVTRMMWAQCYTGYKPPRDECLATYERTGKKAK